MSKKRETLDMMKRFIEDFQLPLWGLRKGAEEWVAEKNSQQNILS
jgi:hypothetical protein